MSSFYQPLCKRAVKFKWDFYIYRNVHIYNKLEYEQFLLKGWKNLHVRGMHNGVCGRKKNNISINVKGCKNSHINGYTIKCKHVSRSNININEDEEEKKIIFGNKNVNGNTLLKYIENDKRLLLYTLCKIFRKKKNEQIKYNSLFNNFHQDIMEAIIEKESKLSFSEKLVYLSCVNNKEYAEKINLTKDNNHKYIKCINDKNLYNYFCTILKQKKNNNLSNEEITEDIQSFLGKKINKNILNSISNYLFNLSYLNSKNIIETNSLYYFSLYILKYIKNKIKKRMSIIQLASYAELLTSIMCTNKLKMEKEKINLSYQANIESFNTLMMMNKNEYSFESSNFSKTCRNHILTNQNCNITTSSYNLTKTNLSYIDNHFIHYFNSYNFVREQEDADFVKEQKCVKKQNENIQINNYKKKECAERLDLLNMNNQENEIEGNKNDQYDEKRLQDMTFEIKYMIYIMNQIIICALKKCLHNFKKGIKNKKFKECGQNILYVITNYMFNSLQYNIFCISLFQTLEGVLLQSYSNSINNIKNKNRYISRNENENTTKMTKNFFDLVPITSKVYLIHLYSLNYNINNMNKCENSIIFKNCLNELFLDDCKSLRKREKVLLYISISKIFLSKKKYIEKLNNILSNELINFTYRDLYIIVYALSCSKYNDPSFIETLLRNIYKLKHKYSNSKLLTIISIFHSFNVNTSVFNMLLSYYNRNESVSHKVEEIPSENNSPKSIRKLEEDLENKERILMELSAHIKQDNNDNFTFTESDMLEFHSSNNTQINGESDKEYIKKNSI
ncbi:conserved Plasmodium protein, unknown function [Plasmodium berghei]|uniref:Uncharacterized protein n=1 Tax=Plasmodium berghei TaxID=5821 RepID=A0A113T773_PLABE|nr:conserved Plasmodium protein, unknown function [Plasmodium berghei]SCM27036.1 conserved Plasmodium protein, unknown function [Plasmodium berghei]SCN28762.1 conserved Plasmodium protein, unknown function [Plasmodium berghei]SCO63034.1 conserved Plasmodium protein, unknown function [Plasmodium berghei]SCO64509.1 conserved Plasmodium protein, unknown function [Plasmodium berghei]